MIHKWRGEELSQNTECAVSKKWLKIHIFAKQYVVCSILILNVKHKSMVDKSHLGFWASSNLELEIQFANLHVAQSESMLGKPVLQISKAEAHIGGIW